MGKIKVWYDDLGSVITHKAPALTSITQGLKSIKNKYGIRHDEKGQYN